MLGAVTLFAVAGGLRATGRPPSLVAWTSLGTSFFAGVGMWFLFTRTRSGHRRGWTMLGMATIVPVVGFVLWRYALGHVYELASPWPTRAGYRCFALSVATGGTLLCALLLAWRRLDPMSPAATGAAFGAGAGLGTALLIDLWCPVSYLPHLLVGHALPVAVLAAAGAAIGGRVLGISARRSRTPGPVPPNARRELRAGICAPGAEDGEIAVGRRDQFKPGERG